MNNFSLKKSRLLILHGLARLSKGQRLNERKENNGRKVSYAQKGLGVRPKHLLLSSVSVSYCTIRFQLEI